MGWHCLLVSSCQGCKDVPGVKKQLCSESSSLLCQGRIPTYHLVCVQPFSWPSPLLLLGDSRLENSLIIQTEHSSKWVQLSSASSKHRGALMGGDTDFGPLVGTAHSTLMWLYLNKNIKSPLAKYTR